MKLLPIVTALWSVCAVWTAACAAEPVFPPGSRLGLVPPHGMVLSKSFNGFENPPQASAITLVEMPPEAYREMSAGFTPESLKAQGIEVKGREEVKLGERNAVLVSGEQSVPGAKIRKWLVVAEDPGLTAFVVAQATLDPGGLSDEEMRASLTSLAIRPPLSIDEQIAALPFRMPELAGFRPVRAMGGSAVFLTDGPKDVVPAAEQPVVIIAQAAAGNPAPAQRDNFARTLLQGNAIFKDIWVERAQGFRQKGADWHEIVARANDTASGQPVVLTQTIRFGPGGYLRMLGVVRANARDEVMPRFRAIFDAVQAE